MVRRRSITKSNKCSRKRSNKQIKKKSRRRSKKKINRKSNRKSKRRSRKTLRKKSKKTIKLKGGAEEEEEVRIAGVTSSEDAWQRNYAVKKAAAKKEGRFVDLTAKKKKTKSKKGFSHKTDDGASLCDGTHYGRESWYYEKTSAKDAASDKHEFKGQRVCCPPGAKRDDEMCVPVPTRTSLRKR